MAVPTSDQLLAESLLQEAASGFETIGRSMAAAYDRWVAEGTDEQTLDWLAGLLDQAGWWHGRLTAQLATANRDCREHPDDLVVR